MEPLLRALAQFIREQRVALTEAWLAELRSRIDAADRRLFPTQSLLNGIPRLLGELADLLEPDQEDADLGFVEEELSELVALRRSQGYGAHELVAEFTLFGELLLGAIADSSDAPFADARPRELVRTIARLQSLLLHLSDASGRLFERLVEQAEHDRRELLRGYVERLGHDVRSRVAAARTTIEVARRAEPHDRDALLEHMDGSLDRIGEAFDAVSLVLGTTDEVEGSSGRVLELSRVVDQVLGDLGPLAADAGVELRIVRPLPTTYVEAVRLQLILLNLLSNGIKYRERDRSTSWIELSAELSMDGELLSIRVDDNGIGIPEPMRDHLFEPYQRGSNVSAPGFGLGLSLARDAARQLGGDLRFEARDEGARFRVTLPAPASELERVSTPEPELEPASEPERAGEPAE